MFLDALMAEPKTQFILVVFLTANADLLDLQKRALLWVNRTIPKPFNPITLHHEIKAALGWNSGVL